MPAKASGEIKTRIVHQSQKNGDIYVLGRRTLYEPVKKYNRVLSSRILSKIQKGEDSPVPTRPKRRKDEKVKFPSASPSVMKASREKTGMMDIIDHIGKVSGIDAAIYDSTDPGTAQKILSLARYLLATNGQSFPGITAWQYTHSPMKTESRRMSIMTSLGRSAQMKDSSRTSSRAGVPSSGDMPCWLMIPLRYQRIPGTFWKHAAGSIRPVMDSIP